MLVCGRALGVGSMNEQVGVAGREARLETLSKRRKSLPVILLLLVPELQRRQHSQCQRDRFSPRPQTVLLMAAEQQRRDRRVVPQQEGADPQRTLEFVGGDREGVNPQPAKVDRQLACHLDCIRMQRHAGVAANRSQFADGLKDTRLVVAEQDADQTRFRREQFDKAIGADHPVAIGRKRIDLPAFLDPSHRRLQNAGVFDRGDDDMAGYLALACTLPMAGYAEDRKVVRLGSPASENKPIGLPRRQIGAKNGGDFLASVREQTLCPLPGPMLAGWVGVPFPPGRGHGLNDFRARGSRRIVVQIDCFHNGYGLLWDRFLTDSCLLWGITAALVRFKRQSRANGRIRKAFCAPASRLATSCELSSLTLRVTMARRAP